MKFVIINGSSCSGKSAVIDVLFGKLDRYFYLKYDNIKRKFSHYNHETHKPDVNQLMRCIMTEVCALGYNVICDSAQNSEHRKLLIDIALSNNYQIVEINLEADYNILLERFEKRIVSVKEKGDRIPNTSVERFNEIYDSYNKMKNPDAITYRTDKADVDTIVTNLLELLEQK